MILDVLGRRESFYVQNFSASEGLKLGPRQTVQLAGTGA